MIKMIKCIISFIIGKKAEKDHLFTDCICKLEKIEKKLLETNIEEDGN